MSDNKDKILAGMSDDMCKVLNALVKIEAKRAANDAKQEGKSFSAEDIEHTLWKLIWDGEMIIDFDEPRDRVRLTPPHRRLQ